MAWFPVVTQVVGTIMQVGGMMQQRSAAKAAAEAARVQAENVARVREFEAEQQRVAAGQEQASAQRAALEEERRGRLIASRALAVAGASGGGVSDPTIINLLADLEGESAYRSAVSIYQGEDRARQLRMGADASTYEAAVTRQGGEMRAAAYRMQARQAGFGAAGTLMSGGSKLLEKYGGTQPPAPVQEGPTSYQGLDARFFG